MLDVTLGGTTQPNTAAVVDATKETETGPCITDLSTRSD